MTGVEATVDGPRPFLKWVGGKRQLLPELLARTPESFGTYFEPFVGGGALFFALRPKRAVLSDSNKRLIRAYRGVKNWVENTIPALRDYSYEREAHEHARKLHVDDLEFDSAVAAWLIYVNRACFNGLCRVNSKNEFNVPFGRYTNPTICDVKNLRACSAAPTGVDLHAEDFGGVLEHAVHCDFVYFDPPHASLSATSNSRGYTNVGFDSEDQRRLRNVALELKRRGVYVLLSNSAAPLVRELYAEGFKVEEVDARRAVSLRGDRRGTAKELIIT